MKYPILCLLQGLLLIQELDVSLSLYVAVPPHRDFSHSPSSLFGYRVRQFITHQGARIIVGEPGSGLLHVCDVTDGSCDNITLSEDTSSSLDPGVTLEVDPTARHLIACGPSKPHNCDQTPHMNGLCYMFNSSLSVSGQLTPGYQDCQKSKVDLCFLYDGSSSAGNPEHKAMKDFMTEAIKNLSSTSIHFAAVQFSNLQRTEFSFADYQNASRPDELLSKATPLGGSTKTYAAINYTLYNIFTEEKGSRANAKKVLLILTDGETDDKDNNSIEEANRRGVIRYIIGLGNNFNGPKAKQYLQSFASKPHDSHIKLLEKFQDLKNFFNDLQKIIHSIEGVAQGEEFSEEFSSAGFSAAQLKDTLVLGDPGIYDWSGGILEVRERNMLINVSNWKREKSAYLGYSVRLLQTRKALFCVAGAPRFEYRGLVMLLRKRDDSSGWEELQRQEGEQVGSYFGSELMVSDLNDDSVTDTVLISAPHYQEGRRSGRVFVCLFSKDSLSCSTTLHGEPDDGFSQFGSSLATLGDLDGDGLREVAVGAPCEAEGRGAVYIYRGDLSGLKEPYIQRLVGPSGRQGFGLSIHGVLDMTEDGLADIAVGSWGHVTLHRSQPLLNVTVNITFEPPEIPIPNLETASCDSEITLTACMYPKKLTPSYKGHMNISLLFLMKLDLLFASSRVSFKNQDPIVIETFHIRGEEPMCQNFSVVLVNCFLENVTPVQVSLNFSLGPNTTPWILSSTSNTVVTSEVPFQICGTGGVCGSDLRVNFQEHSTLVVQHGSTFHLVLELQNTGEKGHFVTMTTSYPSGLIYRTANIMQKSRHITLSCGVHEPQNLLCNISHPILWQRTRAVIQIMFGINTTVSWAESVQIEVIVSSENEKNETFFDNRVMRNIPVLYPINVITRSLDKSMKFVKFSDNTKTSFLNHSYEIMNLLSSAVAPEVTIYVTIPMSLPAGLEWDIQGIQMKPTGNCVPVNKTEILQSAQTTSRNMFVCMVQRLTVSYIDLVGVLRITKKWQEQTFVSVNSSVTISFNESHYHRDKTQNFHTAQVVTQVELLLVPNHMAYITGGSLGGLLLLLLLCVLLYKCGFFKRYKDRVDLTMPPHEEEDQFAEETQQVKQTRSLTRN
ncbi:integrin alpha-L [Bombina bombina]|uniref:integrin alpha-L n=1 Tax=Bombina bombina TaxID=8345 RepID=UPI00235A8827|nr:integrin alpha-L [Bombina bombina]